MFYLAVVFSNSPYTFWLSTEPTPLGLMIGITSTDALTAEAFAPQHVEQIRQMVLHTWPNCECFPIECNSQKIIPENMRKVLNIA